MSRASPAGGLLAPVERLLDALVDPARRERTGLWLMLAYIAAWSLYGAIAKSSQDLHFDMGEMVALSREDLLGTPKHPPFGSWLVRLWFSVFPLDDWTYYLFAVVIATIGLWIAWKLSADYLDGEKRVIGLALLTLVPLYNFQALKFNANSVLIPLWAATTWWFLRSLETRNLGYAAFAGLAAAAAMLGKYWSVFLLAGLAVAALADPRRGAYFRSAAPWVTVAFGGIALAPHVVWLAVNDFPPLHYSLVSHALASYTAAFLAALDYVAGGLAYLAAPVVLAATLSRPSLAALADTLWPRDPSRRMVLLAFALPILLSAVAMVALKSAAPAIWMMSALTLAPVVMLSSPLLMPSRTAAVRILAFAVVFPVVMVAASPVIAIVIHRNGLPNDASHYRSLAAAIDKAWRETSDRPLRIVGSNTNLVNGVMPYLPSRPSAYEIMAPALTPWVDEARIAREGIAMACRSDDAVCMAFVNQLAAQSASAKRVEVELSRTFLGHANPTVRFTIVTAPPRS